MQLVERHIIRNDKAVEQVCFNAARLYNFCNYYMRQAYFGKIQKFGEYELSGLLTEFNQEDFRSLPSNVSQQVIKLLFKNWKSFWRAQKEFKKNPSKFNGRPTLPGYKDRKGYSIAIFTNSVFRFRNSQILFPKKIGLKSVTTKATNIKQVRLIPQATCFVIEVVYNKEQKTHDLDKEKFLAIDLGLNNLATCVSNVGRPFIANGKVLKSKNQYYNKKKAELMSYIGAKGTSNKISGLTFHRNNFIDDKMHKTSRKIVNYCLENCIGTIIIGHNENWKREINIGKRNNQNFVNIPHGKLIDKITYKALLVGIEVKLAEESHTSKIDHLALEPLMHQDKYLGTRKFRGLFQSSTGKLINADVNGAIGIARKVFGDSYVNGIVDSGLAFRPVRFCA